MLLVGLLGDLPQLLPLIKGIVFLHAVDISTAVVLDDLAFVIHQYQIGDRTDVVKLFQVLHARVVETYPQPWHGGGQGIEILLAFIQADVDDLQVLALQVYLLVVFLQLFYEGLGDVALIME